MLYSSTYMSCRAWSEESSSSQPTAFSCCRLVRASLLADTRKNRYHARSIASRWLAVWGRKKLCLFIFSNSAAVTVTHDDFQVMPSVTYFIQSGLAKGSRTPYLSVNIPSEIITSIPFDQRVDQEVGDSRKVISRDLLTCGPRAPL